MNNGIFCMRNDEIYSMVEYMHILEMSRTNAYNRTKVILAMDEFMCYVSIMDKPYYELIGAWANFVGDYACRRKEIAKDLNRFQYAEQLFDELVHYYIFEA